MIPKSETDEFCISCRLNDTIPDLTEPHNRTPSGHWQRAPSGDWSTACFAGSPVGSKKAQGASGVAFRFLSDVKNPDGSVSRTLTGHSEGTITLNIAEADDAYRESVRNEMKEPYRTLLGHFRHEIGHDYWDRLVRDTAFLEPYRALFGDERSDYMQSLQHYYEVGALAQLAGRLSLAPMPPLTPGKIGQRPGRIFCTSKTPSKSPMILAWWESACSFTRQPTVAESRCRQSKTVSKS